MNELVKVFESEEFGSVRTVEVDRKIYFCGKDVATALAYKDTVNAIKLHCKEDGVVFHHVIDKLGESKK